MDLDEDGVDGVLWRWGFMLMAAASLLSDDPGAMNGLTVNVTSA